MMTPLLVTILNCVLIAMFVTAALGGFWANHHMMKRAKALGGGFWMFNPLAQFAGMTLRHTAILFAWWIVGAFAVVGLILLNHGLDALLTAWSDIKAGPRRGGI